MEIWDKVVDVAKTAGDKAVDAAKVAGDKASDVVETTKLKNKITGEKKSIEIEMAKIGRIYYEKAKAGEELDPQAMETISRIDAHYDTIAETEEALRAYDK